MSLRLKHSPADIVGQGLIDKSEGASPSFDSTNTYNGAAWPVFIGVEPASPDNVIVVNDTTPKSDGRSQIDGEAFQHYGFQIKIRGADHPTAYRKAESIRVTINENMFAHTVRLETSVYVIASIAMTSLLKMGKEVGSSKRDLFSINGLVTITPIS